MRRREEATLVLPQNCLAFRKPHSSPKNFNIAIMLFFFCIYVPKHPKDREPLITEHA